MGDQQNRLSRHPGGRPGGSRGGFLGGPVLLSQPVQDPLDDHKLLPFGLDLPQLLGQLLSVLRSTAMACTRSASPARFRAVAA